jgi:hypothetical protein
LTDPAFTGDAPADLEQVMDRIVALAHTNGFAKEGRVSVADVMAAIGERSFGPLLLVPSLIGLSPVGAIPGIPAITSAVVILVAAQILMGFVHFWIPGWLARRSIDAHKLERGLNALKPGARFVDKFLLRPRLPLLTRGPFFYLIAALCLIVGLVTPIIELVPLAGIVPNAALVAFALAITARDGLWALLAFIFTAASAWLIAMGM